ncbi:MAG: ribbon-helix-helix protein, CopG family [Polyangiaceae bacterium]
MTSPARRLVQARLDAATAARLEEMRAQTGLTSSEILRRALAMFASTLPASRSSRKVIGLGRFASGVRDLGSNRKHLEGFGRS